MSTSAHCTRSHRTKLTSPATSRSSQASTVPAYLPDLAADLTLLPSALRYAQGKHLNHLSEHTKKYPNIARTNYFPSNILQEEEDLPDHETNWNIYATV